MVLKKVMIINSVSGFISEIEKITKDDDVVVFFRGHGDEAYEMKPSIFRPFSQAFHLLGNLYSRGNLYPRCNISLPGGASLVGGVSPLGDVCASGRVSFSGTISFSGNVTLSGNISSRSKRKGIVSFVDWEHLMFRDFVARYDAEFRDCFYTMDFLVKMQHYDLPTRTLDLTTNCLVALYFACLGSCDQNGEVIVFSIPEDAIRHYDSDKVSAIANLAKVNDVTVSSRRFLRLASPNKKFCDCKFLISILNRSPDIKRLLHEIRREKPYYQSIIDPNDLLDNIVTVIPKQNNPRVKNQSGAFLLFGLGEDGIGGYTKKEHPPVPDDWIVLGKRSNGTANRLIVDGCAKKKILKELAQMGITESFIFPEMDKYAKELKEKYS